MTTAAIDVHVPTSTVQPNPVSSTRSDSSTGASQCSGGRTARPADGATPGSSVTACSSSVAQNLRLGHGSLCCPASLSGLSPCRDPSVVVQDLLSSLSEEACLAHKGLVVDPVNLKVRRPTGSQAGRPSLDNRGNILNCRNQGGPDGRGQGCALLQTKPLIHLQDSSTEVTLEEKHQLLGPADPPVGHRPDT